MSNAAPWLPPTHLELPGGAARLEPLAADHAPDLLATIADAAVWRFMPDAPPADLPAMQTWLTNTLTRAAAGLISPFAIVDRTNGRCVGSTRFLDLQPHHRGVEIGYTWLAPQVQRTAINTECKFLLLRYAFEVGSAIRVQLKTDARNEQSQRAILRIGAKFEGCLRHNMLMHDGHRRDSMYYSILASEWPEVSRRLLESISSRRTI